VICCSVLQQTEGGVLIHGIAGAAERIRTAPRFGTLSFTHAVTDVAVNGAGDIAAASDTKIAAALMGATVARKILAIFIEYAFPSLPDASHPTTRVQGCTNYFTPIS
jgi:hypothetical protein